MAGFEETNSTAAAVIIDLHSMCALQTARILARHGIPVFATARDGSHPHCRTNTCRKVVVADSRTDSLIIALEKLGRELDTKAVAYPCSDEAVLAVSRNRQHLARWYHIALPEPELVEMLSDKATFYQYASAHGLPIPTTFFARSRSDLQAAASQLTYPCVLKPATKGANWGVNARAKAYKIDSVGELYSAYDRCAAWAATLIAQQWIEGGDASLYSCNCYFNTQSEPLVSFVARKLRQWPPYIGCSCLGEECRNDVVLKQTLELFRNLKWRGLAYLEMKQDQRTGKHYIVEPNVGRPTGRSAIAEAGGVELLYTMYCDLLGLPLPAARVQRYQRTKWIYLRNDLRSALWHWRRGELSIADILRSWRGVKIDAVFSLADARPFFSEVLNAVSHLFRFSGAIRHVLAQPVRSPRQVPKLPEHVTPRAP